MTIAGYFLVKCFFAKYYATLSHFAESNGDLGEGFMMLFWKSTILGDKGVVFRYVILRILVSRFANIFSETTSNNGKDAQN